MQEVASTFAVMAARCWPRRAAGRLRSAGCGGGTRKITAREARRSLPATPARLIYSSISASYEAVPEGGFRLSVGFSFDTGGVLGSGLPLGVFGGETLGCLGGLAEQLVKAGRLVIRAGSAVGLRSAAECFEA